MGYIYLRTNLINGKKYVGQTKDIEKRNHDWNRLNARYGGHAINNARKKYGADGFSFEILKECPNKDMNYWEMYYIKEYNTKKPYGYNSTDGGDSTYERTEETKAKIAAALRGKPNPKTATARRGMKLSEETKAKIGVASRGRKHSEETKEKIAATKRGRKCPEETKAKIADTLRGRKRPDIAAVEKNHPKKSKAVQALDKATGEVVMEFPSTREAERQGFHSGAVSQCCQNCYSIHKGNIYKGFIWRFAV